MSYSIMTGVRSGGRGGRFTPHQLTSHSIMTGVRSGAVKVMLAFCPSVRPSVRPSVGPSDCRSICHNSFRYRRMLTLSLSSEYTVLRRSFAYGKSYLFGLPNRRTTRAANKLAETGKNRKRKLRKKANGRKQSQ